MTKEYMTFKYKGQFSRVKLTQIIYLEQISRYTTIHTGDGHYYFYGKISEIADSLPSNFFKCHRSYVLNMDKIREINNSQIIMMNGDIITLCGANHYRTKREFKDYLGI